ncbi:hypothetical protein ACIHDR_28330 [Nocardia sp. NPDC052278]|uniref:hypothetical protein n=1 Tax=unclassified Nocardia TaxID=2637762 RepID=UPI003680490E
MITGLGIIVGPLRFGSRNHLLETSSIPGQRNTLHDKHFRASAAGAELLLEHGLIPSPEA